jgi:hypothetical protein
MNASRFARKPARDGSAGTVDEIAFQWKNMVSTAVNNAAAVAKPAASAARL